MSELGDLIRGARLRLNLQAYEVSNAVGLSPSWFSRLEAGKVANTPPPETLHALARTLKLQPPEMLAALGYRLTESAVATLPVTDPRMAELVAKLERIRLDDERWPHTANRIGTLTGLLDMWLRQDRDADNPIKNMVVDAGNGGTVAFDDDLAVHEP